MHCYSAQWTLFWTALLQGWRDRRCGGNNEGPQPQFSTHPLKKGRKCQGAHDSLSLIMPKAISKVPGRTFAVGDIHGDIGALHRVLARLPELCAEDTIVFLGDYVDRGPHSREVVDLIRVTLPTHLKAKIVALRGNHEDGWLRVQSGGWPEFVLPPGNGCIATYRSFVGQSHNDHIPASDDEMALLQLGDFFPNEVTRWLEELPYFYEDAHAIYVHAGLVEDGKGAWLHPKDTPEPAHLLWLRTMKFFREYSGKRVVIGHTSTDHLPPELSQYTPEDPLDMWVRDNLIAIDTGSGKGGFLTAVELPSLEVYESR
jgi:serine/threonine protein phosphatase 1